MRAQSSVLLLRQIPNSVSFVLLSVQDSWISEAEITRAARPDGATGGCGPVRPLAGATDRPSRMRPPGKGVPVASVISREVVRADAVKRTEKNFQRISVRVAPTSL